MLCDGGVYDNLGLETALKRYRIILVSDAGQKIAPEERPHTDWARHSLRILETIDNQVRSLRRRQLIDMYINKDRAGTYWGVRTDFNDYRLDQDPLGCAGRSFHDLAEIPTRLERMSRPLQDRLMNWGYAICDAALRRHIDGAVQAKLQVRVDPPSGFPFAGGY
jgi:NTE family protein